jgi:hypothetical protein
VARSARPVGSYDRVSKVDTSMGELLDDGFGMQVRKCDDADCGLEIVRPGKVQCGKCEPADLWDKGVLGTDERYVRVVHDCLICGKFHGDGVPCPDPLCPCQDGDACHYRDLPRSPAMPPPDGYRDDGTGTEDWSTGPGDSNG